MFRERHEFPSRPTEGPTPQDRPGGDRRPPGVPGAVAMVVNRVFRSFRVEGYFECRRCGRTLEGPVDACGACGAEDVAHYPPWVFESRE